MKIKDKISISKDELAKIFLDSAKSILEKGAISIRENVVDLPETFEMELEYKEKKDRTKFEIELVWNNFETNGHHAKDMPTSVIPIKSSTAIPDSFKSVKKEMEKVLTGIEKSLKNNQTPRGTDIDHFINLIQAFRKRSKTEWLPSINLLESNATSLKNDLLANKLSEAMAKIDEIRNLKSKYHKVFK